MIFDGGFEGFIFDKSAHSSGTASVARLAPGQPLFGVSRGFGQGMSQTAPSAKRCVLSSVGRLHSCALYEEKKRSDGINCVSCAEASPQSLEF